MTQSYLAEHLQVNWLPYLVVGKAKESMINYRDLSLADLAMTDLQLTLNKCNHLKKVVYKINFPSEVEKSIKDFVPHAKQTIGSMNKAPKFFAKAVNLEGYRQVFREIPKLAKLDFADEPEDAKDALKFQKLEAIQKAIQKIANKFFDLNARNPFLRKAANSNFIKASPNAMLALSVGLGLVSFKADDSKLVGMLEIGVKDVKRLGGYLPEAHDATIEALNDWYSMVKKFQNEMPRTVEDIFNNQNLKEFRKNIIQPDIGR